MERRLALTWQLSEVHGWGLVGMHTCLYLAERGTPPLLLSKPALATLRPENRAALQGLEAGLAQVEAIAARHPEQVLKLQGFDVLHALGNGFEPGPVSARFRGERDVGVIAYEDTKFDAGALARARVYDRIVVHSTYNQRLLEERGFTNVRCALQGIDPTEMGRRPPTGRFAGRFAVFSGGKLEFRKAQDLVLAAFRRFRERRPEALLVTAWHNPWAHTALGMAESRHAPVPPAIGADGRLRIAEWAAANGVPSDAFVDLGFLGRPQIAPLLAECRVAVFPNRCEGATNLVAMEAMACGVPVVLSANTGHLDIVREGACLTLDRQTPVPDPGGCRAGWGESDVDELVERLESVYADPDGAAERAGKAMDFIHGERTWRRFAEAFVRAAA